MSKKFLPTLVVIDYETSLENGDASVEFYRDDFRIDSCAFSWFTHDGTVKNRFIEGESEVRRSLELIAKQGIPVWGYNLQFELGCTVSRFPSLDLNWGGDVMRLVQVYDNGGKGPDYKSNPFGKSIDELLAEFDEEGNQKEKKEFNIGLALTKAIRRILPKEYHNHKDEAYEWIGENVEECRKGQEGQYLNRLPKDIMRRYNTADSELTLRLYKFITDHFKEIGYDWSFDHSLYMGSVRRIVSAKVKGANVDRNALDVYRTSIEVEIGEIYTRLRKRFRIEIEQLEQEKLESIVYSRKTERGQINAWLRVIEDNSYRFNVGSNKQLEALFLGKLGMECKFRTEKGAPTFRSAVIHQYGEGGEIIKERRKRLLVLKQSEALLKLSSHDGRWHVDLKAAGTSTGRFAGGSHA